MAKNRISTPEDRFLLALNAISAAHNLLGSAVSSITDIDGLAGETAHVESLREGLATGFANLLTKAALIRRHCGDLRPSDG